MTRTVLLIDDEPNMRWVVGRALEQAGYTVHSAEDGNASLSILAHEPIDLVLLDLKLRGEDGLTILRRLRERQPDLVIVILTAYGTVPTAVEAMQLGAADFLRKPFDVEEIIFKIARALERHTMQQELARLTILQRSAPAFESLVGAEVSWQRLMEQARHVAQMDEDVLIVGERGSGRTTLARAVHVASARASAPLIEIDLAVYHDAARWNALFGCAGHSGAWATAGSGSVVLRGVAGIMNVHDGLVEHLTRRTTHNAPRLLMVAPDASLPESLQSLLPARVRVPPLRERPGDVLLLAHFFAHERPITPCAAQLLEHYAWPGNVAELRGVIERAARLARIGPIDVIHLPDRLKMVSEDDTPGLGQLPAEGVNLEQLEQTLIRQALERTHGNKSRAAELLGLTRHTLIYRMEKHGISTPDH